ncbi:hypothetical protein EMIT0P253_90061 [Pseudomonas sp. IT-P253]
MGVIFSSWGVESYFYIFVSRYHI